MRRGNEIRKGIKGDRWVISIYVIHALIPAAAHTWVGWHYYNHYYGYYYYYFFFFWLSTDCPPPPSPPPDPALESLLLLHAEEFCLQYITYSTYSTYPYIHLHTLTYIQYIHTYWYMLHPSPYRFHPHPSLPSTCLHRVSTVHAWDQLSTAKKKKKSSVARIDIYDYIPPKKPLPASDWRETADKTDGVLN